MAPLEGMASGVPFVGSDAGYYRAFSAQGKTGLIVPVDAASDAADAAKAVLAEPERYAAYSRDARDVAQHSSAPRPKPTGLRLCTKKSGQRGRIA